MSGTTHSRPTANRTTTPIRVVVLLFLLLGLLSGTLSYRSPTKSRSSPADPAVVNDRQKTLEETIFPVRAYSPVETGSDRVRVEYGSCIAVSRKGTFLTAAHVVDTRAKKSKVIVLVKGRELAATVSPTAPGSDVVVLNVPD